MKFSNYIKNFFNKNVQLFDELWCKGKHWWYQSIFISSDFYHYMIISVPSDIWNYAILIARQGCVQKLSLFAVLSVVLDWAGIIDMCHNHSWHRDLLHNGYKRKHLYPWNFNETDWYWKLHRFMNDVNCDFQRCINLWV